MNHNQLIDDTLVKSAMERICANITEIFLHRLERISNGGGCCFENALVDFSEHITEEDYESEDYSGDCKIGLSVGKGCRKKIMNRSQKNA